MKKILIICILTSSFKSFAKTNYETFSRGFHQGCHFAAFMSEDVNGDATNSINRWCDYYFFNDLKDDESVSKKELVKELDAHGFFELEKRVEAK